MTSDAHTFTFDRGIASLVWAEFDVSVVFDRFHEDRRSHDVGAEMSCFVGTNGSRELLHRARLNLGSTRARADAAKYLTGREGSVDWAGLLEQCAWQVLDAFRRGRDPVLLRDVVVDESIARFVVPPLLVAHDPVILFGDGGSAKSFVGLALAMSSESGIAYAALPVSQRLKTAYLDFEWQASPHRRRIQSLCANDPLPPLLYVPCGAEGPLSAQVERLQRIIHEHSIRYVFLDSVALACAGPPEEAAVALDFFQALTRLEAGSCLLAHINRSGDEDRPFGSTLRLDLLAQQRPDDVVPQAIPRARITASRLGLEQQEEQRRPQGPLVRAPLRVRAPPDDDHPRRPGQHPRTGQDTSAQGPHPRAAQIAAVDGRRTGRTPRN